MENDHTKGFTKSTSGGAASDVLLVEKSPKKNLVNADLSAEIAMTVEKEKGERVRVRRVYGDNYRANWLALDTRAGSRSATFALDSYRVRASKFLRARKVGDQLVIEDLTAQARNN
jgi:hypothetical protein